MSTPPSPIDQNRNVWKYKDPSTDPARKGMLLSNEIERFCKKQLLIVDYKPEHLRPASYTLTIGPAYVDSSGKIKKLKSEQPFFYMEPNSIVYVTTREVLDLPYYIAARFNLRVKWVYKGILLGTGPQVEPGFRGNLSCPLFNLTNRSIKIKLDEEFATIDFERTTAFCPGQNSSDIEKNRKTLENVDEVSFGGDRFLMFKQQSFPPLKHLPDHDIVSSLVQLSDEVKTWRAVGIGTVVAFVGLALTLLNFQNNLYRELRSTTQQVSDLKQQLAAQQAQTLRPQQNVPNPGTSSSTTPQVPATPGKATNGKNQ
jgi:deoxycytidine triphosphate deaminase